MRHFNCRRVIIIATILFVLTNPCLSQIHIAGEIEGTLIDTTYIADGDIVVGGSLTIEPGAVILFEEGVQFDVDGLLVAEGTEEDTIYFILNEEAEYWGGIDFNFFSHWDCSLQYCHISGSNSSGIYNDRGYPSVQNCLITGNSVNDQEIGYEHGGGIFWKGYNTDTIIECTISNNSNCGIYADRSTRMTVENSIISDNSDGGIVTDANETNLSHCVISNNYSDDNGGGIYSMEGARVYLDHCLIYNNDAGEYGGGIYTEPTAYELTVNNCTISNNTSISWGGAIYSFSNNTIIRNSIISNNIGDHGACLIFSDIDIEFNDFFNNENGDISMIEIEDEDLGIINQINENGDSCDVYFNIFQDPLFADSDNGDYSLLAESPCIDAGNPESEYDPDGTITDMGAIYFEQENNIRHNNSVLFPTKINLSTYPNPFNSTVNISFSLFQAENIELSVYNILGKKILSSSWQHLNPGLNSLSIDMNEFPSGTYHAHLNLLRSKVSTTTNLILLK